MGSYRVMRRISPPGGFVETFAGRASTGDKPVLLKRIVEHRAGLGERLLGLSRLRIAGLPTVVEVATVNDELWVVLDGQEGESLRWVMSTLARAAGFIAPNEGLAVVARVAQTLDGLHRHGLTHGDVCPSTIFLTQRGEVQLHDALIAATLGQQGDLGPYRCEMNALAPEQVGAPATPPSDVFRLGLLLYELAIGRPLWSGPSPAHLCHAATGWGGLTRDKVKQVPEPWLTLLVTMLNVVPGARPTMEEVGAVLEQAVTQNGWATGEVDVARLFARAAQNRTPHFAAPPTTGQELLLTPLVHAPAPSPAPSPPRPVTPSGTPAVTPPGAVVARITTRKMTREALAAVRSEPALQPPPQTLEPALRAAHLLVERAVLTAQQVQTAKEQATMAGCSVLAALAEQGADEDALVATISEVTHTSSISTRKVTEAQPGPDALALVPLALSREAEAVPLGLKGGTQLMVAMADPLDPRAVAALKAALGARSLITFRAGPRAIANARARLYPGGGDGDFELTRSDPPVEAAPRSELPARLIDALLALQGVRGAQAQQLVSLAAGLARRFNVSEAEVALARLVSGALVTSALTQHRLPHDVPKLLDVQESIGFGTEADAFVEALHSFPARMPERPVVKAVVLAFAFAAHAGDARPSGSRLGGALNSFRVRHQLAPPLFEALSRELSAAGV